VAESQYQAKIIKKLERLFPGCFIIRTDPAHRQGVPDLIVLWRKHWAALEVKLSPLSNVQPNQDYYIDQLNSMMFGAYIYPDNEEEVLDALQQAFESPRRARVPQS
jgi:hypothetical protein